MNIAMLIYVLIGIIYTMINGIIRKLDHDDDWMLPISWIFLWPIFFIALIVKRLSKAFKK